MGILAFIWSYGLSLIGSNFQEKDVLGLSPEKQKYLESGWKRRS